MKVFEIRDLSPKELAEKVIEKEEELANIKFQHSLHQVDNTANVTRARRELARFVTILHEHEKGIRKLEQSSARDEELL